jgi:hypothetical protein
LFAWMAGAILITVFAGAWVIVGSPNADEGWYLTASRLVFQGRLPYRDFAFTQMPLLPYVYGVSQLLPMSPLYMGRLTSLALFVAATLIAFGVVRRKAGAGSAWLFLIAALANAWVAYYCVLVKTYALVSLLFVACWAILSADRVSTRRLAVVSALALAAVGVRLSAAGFALPVVVAALWAAKSRHARLWVLGVTLASAAAIGAFILQAPDVAHWHVVSHHMNQWRDPNSLHRIDKVFTRRVPHFILWFWPDLLVTAFVLDQRRRARKRLATAGSSKLGFSPEFACALGLCGFTAAHFATGNLHMEYFAPVTVAGIPMLVIAAHRAGLWITWGRRWVLATAMFAAVGLFQFTVHGRNNIDFSGGKWPVSEIRDLAHLIAPRLAPGDSVVALEALWVPVEMQHPVVAGLEMGPFSVYEMGSAEARSLRVVNGSIVAEYLDRATPGAVILTEWDWEEFTRLGVAASIHAALALHYDSVAHWKDFGQRPGLVDAFVRKP